jgi:hypothetical protein
MKVFIPVVGDRPPTFLQPTFAAAVTDDGGINEFLHAIKVSEAARDHALQAPWVCAQESESGSCSKFHIFCDISIYLSKFSVRKTVIYTETNTL